MWIAASVRLMNVGSTSASLLTLSSSLASQRDRMVPTSCAKHSCHTRSGAGRPPALVSVTKRLFVESLTYAYRCRGT